MPSARKCPSCGRQLSVDAPEGLCPACLFMAGLGATGDPLPVGDSISNPPRRAQGSAHAASHLRYFGDYEIREEIAHGGMGVVYRARQINLDRLVALKMILPHRLDEDAIRRFRQEVESAANRDHPNIVPVFEFGEHEGQFFYSMKLIEGRNLADELPRFQEDTRSSAHLMATMARAVHHAHQRGVLHRDLKPQNILIDRDRQPHVTDFGLAKRMEANRDLTHTGDCAGSRDYMSPEQRAGEFKNLTTASDIYSLGAIFYALLTGHPPFHGPKSRIPWMDLPDEPVRPRSLDPRIDVDPETICLKSLDTDPNRRYPTAAALADDLDRWLRGEPITARPASRWERALKWLRRKPVIAALSAAVILVAVLGITGIAWQWRQAVSARQFAFVNRYVAHMNLVQREWESDNIDRVLELLDEERPERAGGADLRGFEWFYWNRLCHWEQLTLRGHRNWVSSVAFSPDGKRLASGGADGTVRVWSAAGGQEILTLGYMGYVYSVAFSRDGRRLAAADSQGTVKLWDVARGEEVFTLKGHTTYVTSVAFSPDGRRLASVTARGDGTVKVWDLASGKEALKLKGHSSVVFSPDGRRIASGGDDGTAKVWDAASGHEVLTLRDDSGPVSEVGFSPDGKWLASATRDGTVKIWDAGNGRKSLACEGHTNGANLAFSPDCKWLASGGPNSTLKVWDAAIGQGVFTLKGHAGGVTSVAFSPDGKRLASTSMDRTVKVWAANSGQDALTFEGHTNGCCDVAFSPDGKWLASSSWDETVKYAVKIWDAATGQAARTLKGHEFLVNSVAFSPDGMRLASASGDGTVKLWDTAGGREILTFREHAGPPQEELARFPGIGNLVPVVTRREYPVLSVAFSPDGKRLASASDEPTVKVWDAATGQVFFTLKRHAAPVASVAFSRDGKQLASASHDGTVILWDALTGQETLTFRGHTRRLQVTAGDDSNWVNGLAFSPDGKWLASGDKDGEVRLWHATTGQGIFTLKGHAGGVMSVAFSPDGKRLASASWDHTVKVWELISGHEILTLKGHTDEVNGVAFSPDGRRLASAAGIVKVWEAPDRP